MAATTEAGSSPRGNRDRRGPRLRTAHHGTTRGCLIALDRLSREIAPSAVLDLGAGSGILAIAAAKAFALRPLIAAVDLDAIAIGVARENCRKNGAAHIRLFVGDGATPALAYEAAPFDVVMANILAKPLLKLAPRLRELTRVGRRPDPFGNALRSSTRNPGPLPLHRLSSHSPARSGGLGDPDVQPRGVECVRKSVKRFSDKTHDKTKS